MNPTTISDPLSPYFGILQAVRRLCISTPPSGRGERFSVFRVRVDAIGASDARLERSAHMENTSLFDGTEFR